MLYIVSTPIGNLEDITLRAIRTLKEVDFILAEDTRRTRILLNKYTISKPLQSYHDRNKEHKTPAIIALLRQGKNIALVSDAGTPAISDPGFYLVRECIRNQITVSPIPGPSSILAALVCSGLPTDRFTFCGFMPKKPAKILRQIKDQESTFIFFESPHRIEKTLAALAQDMPDHQVVVAREITKRFEEFIRGNPKEILPKIKPKGEIVLLIRKT
ncbi:MAG: 16S rRNA (cytidine(1402)-2'-O)-methyltransferase [Candidatus Woesearchaeota archaeon]